MQKKNPSHFWEIFTRGFGLILKMVRIFKIPNSESCLFPNISFCLRRFFIKINSSFDYLSRISIHQPILNSNLFSLHLRYALPLKTLLHKRHWFQEYTVFFSQEYLEFYIFDLDSGKSYQFIKAISLNI